ncbi:SMP-30/gluconolactonase/LRE family protein [Amycolatopsis sp. cmx-11-32]|uniref:SMP-30/gluconolactonase/LRE family protein n=1 Tax=Amycolatopsis sp. cmx-11-32 TaxID=2785796 RepID=UPI0039E6E2EB
MTGRIRGVVAATIVMAAAFTAPSAPAAAASACGPWQVRTVATGLGLPLENLAFDGRGGLLVSKTLFADNGSIERVTPDGAVDTLLPVSGPGALSVRGNELYVNTGHETLDGVLGLKTGTIDIYDFDTGQRRTWATGLTMPDGGTVLPNGDAVISTLIGPKRGLWLVREENPSAPERYGPDLLGPNGMVVGNDGRTLYVANTGGPDFQIAAIDLANPSAPAKKIRLQAPWPLNIIDDLTIGPDGRLYTAGEHGIVYRVDPDSGATCAIATGVHLGSSVRFGAGPGWDPESLYSTGFDGAVRRLVPPGRGE